MGSPARAAFARVGARDQDADPERTGVSDVGRTCPRWGGEDPERVISPRRAGETLDTNLSGTKKSLNSIAGVPDTRRCCVCRGGE